MSDPNRRSKLSVFTSRIRRPSTSLEPLAIDSPSSVRPSYDLVRSPSPNYSDPYTSVHGHEPMTHNNNEDLPLPNRPFSHAEGTNSPLGSRRSSISSLKERPPSLSINYVPQKFTKRHSPGDYAHRRAKQGGGRDAFASNASRMGMMGTVDDDEGVAFQLGKGGLKKKKPKLRWNRFKWALFACNTLLLAYGIAFLVCAILVWLNVFYRSDVIRVGNRTELIISTVAAAVMVLTSLIGFSGIILNNRAFLAVYTLLLWVCLALLVAPGYMTYKQKTFNLEGKINLQWSRQLGTEGRLRIQNALRCCGYFSPYVEATQSPLCFARSNFPGCKNRYLKLERHVLTVWYTISFALVPAQIGIIIAGLLCSNHITYRFGKGLTPKRYRLDLGSMAVIMDEYAGQIAAQYGDQIAFEALNRSSSHLPNDQRQSLSIPPSRQGSSSNLATLATGTAAGYTRPISRFTGSTHSTGYNSQSGRTTHHQNSLYDPSSDTFDTSSRYIDTETEGPSSRYQGGQGEYDYPREYSQPPQPGNHDHHGQYDAGWAR